MNCPFNIILADYKPQFVNHVHRNCCKCRLFKPIDYRFTVEQILLISLNVLGNRLGANYKLIMT